MIKVRPEAFFILGGGGGGEGGIFLIHLLSNIFTIAKKSLI